MDTPAHSSSALWRGVAGWALFIIAETATQIVFKVAGSDLSLDAGFWAMIVKALASPWVWAGFALYLADFLLWMLILKDSDLGRAFPLTALVYVGTLVAAVTLFHEVITPLQMLGVAIIIAGVIALSVDEDTDHARAPTAKGEG